MKGNEYPDLPSNDTITLLWAVLIRTVIDIHIYVHLFYDSILLCEVDHMVGGINVYFYFLHYPDADVEARDETGETPLMEACAWGHLDAVETLITAGRSQLNREIINIYFQMIAAQQREQHPRGTRIITV